MGIKAAGGVRDFAALDAMVRAGATRNGASAGVRIEQQARGGATASAPGAGYRGRPMAVADRCNRLGEMARLFRWVWLGGKGPVGVLKDPPGPSAVRGFPWGGCRRHW